MREAAEEAACDGVLAAYDRFREEFDGGRLKLWAAAEQMIYERSILWAHGEGGPRGGRGRGRAGK